MNQHRNTPPPAFAWLYTLLALCMPFHADAQVIEADLLVVGGTESGCAAAVQAARMGVKRIVLVNDIEWLGGQFSAEALGAIDENRAHGYDGTVPIPRSGLFREVIDAIESKNDGLYNGVRRPGHTRVITTSRPIVSEEVFRELLAPLEASGQLVRFSDFRVESVAVEGTRVQGVEFLSTKSDARLSVRARMTIDASDWGDVIQGAGAEWDCGLDARSVYQEPSAPISGEPATDLNPITWCLVLEEQEQEVLFPEPPGYDPRYFNKLWGWIDETFAYTSRRLVDRYGFPQITHPDILLINTPPIDYPLDTYPASVAAALEQMETGASKKSMVALSAAQREIVFQDAKNHSLKYYHHLQKQFPKFRRMALSDEFGTPDRLPPKPYIRESLRLIAEYMVREQDVLGFEGRSNFATSMFPDAVFSWQFELDFHPTMRSWTSDLGSEGPWEADFRGKRRFGRGGTGRAVFPLRALVPKGMHGLLGAQKSLGYSSIVSSSCRLHDQSIHAGQASGAVAAVCLQHGVDASGLYLNASYLAEIWSGLLEPSSGVPLVIWPFSDIDPLDPGFAGIQHLALRRLLPLDASDTAFRPDDLATSSWLRSLASRVRQAGHDAPEQYGQPFATRRSIAQELWRHLKSQLAPGMERKSEGDADGDDIQDVEDPLPFTPGVRSWTPDPMRDGVPNALEVGETLVHLFNFAGTGTQRVDGCRLDAGERFDLERGYGWDQDMRNQYRTRNHFPEELRDTFAFTRDKATWECVLSNGIYTVTICLGDASYPQPGQTLRVEGQAPGLHIDTEAGRFHEESLVIDLRDGRLRLELGPQTPKTNTTINWLRVLKKTTR